MRINENFAALGGSYLFGKIAARVKQFEAENPRADIVSLGIGDVTRPLTPSVICAMHAAVTEMSAKRLSAVTDPKTATSSCACVSRNITGKKA